MNYPTVTDFKNYFTRDFPYGTDPQVSVTDADIERAQSEAECQINTALFGGQNCFDMAFNYLTAHFLVTNLKNSSQGLSGQAEGILSSKSVSSVSSSFQFPNEWLNNPMFMMIGKTPYGMRYLEIIYPLTRGAMFVTAGKTHA